MIKYQGLLLGGRTFPVYIDKLLNLRMQGMEEFMGEKDLTEKILEDYNDIFADIVNVLLFNGEQRVKPEELTNSLVHSQYKADDSKIHEQERDVAKHWNGSNIEIALYGIENQTKVDNKMPLRVFGYEGASYRSQYHKDSIEPVVTLVLYFGEEHWSSKKYLKELMTIPEGLESYVNDIKLNVFEISWLTDEQIEMFKSDFKIVARFFVEKRKNKEYIPDDRTIITHVDEVLKLLSVMTNDSRYESIDIKKDGGVSMCDVAQRLEDKGIQQGIQQGEINTICRLVQNGKLTITEGAEELNITVDELKAHMNAPK